MSNSKKIIKSTALIVILTLASKILGFLRETLIAYKFGSGMKTDTFFVALTATALITSLISSAISTTFIPVLSQIEAIEGREEKINHTNNMINIISVISIFLLIIAMIFVKLTAGGFSGDQFTLAVKLTRLGLPMILFSGVIGTLTAFLHSEQRYLSSAAIGFPFNMVYIVFLIFFASTFGITGLMVAAVLAVVSQFLIQVPEARRAGFKYKFVFDIRDKYIKKVLYLSLPVLIGVAINDINAIIDRNLASSLVEGSISALNYANKLQGLVYGVFVSAITTVIFPLLSKESNSSNIKGMKKIMGEGINLILLITIPATVGLIILAKPIVEVAFQRGAFTANDTIMTSQALVFYSLGLVGSSLRLLTTRVYYSLQDTKSPMLNGGIAVVLNLILNLILIRFLAHGGLALATSISTTIATLVLLYGLKKKIGSLGTVEWIKCGLKSVLASIVMGIVAYFIYHGLYGILGVSKLNNLIALAIAAGIGALIYGVLCYMLGIKEIKDLVGKGIDRFKKRK